MRRRRGRVVRAAVRGLVLAALVVCAAPLLAQDYPTPNGKVNDYAELLTPAQRTGLEADLDRLERETSAEVAVVTLSSLNGRSVEEYATGLFNAWGIGKKERDNGVLVLVSRGDRRMRIEVGYGLEGILPDGLAGAIVRETFLPRFREERFADGVLEGTARVVDVVRRHETVTDEQRAAYAAAAAEASTWWGMAAFMGIFIGVGAFCTGAFLGARVVLPALMGLFFMAGGAFGALMTAPRASHPLLALFALAVGVAAYRRGRTRQWQRTLRGTSTGGGWEMGGSSSSSGSSSDSGGGSDFGGGSSGGGGASGSW